MKKPQSKKARLASQARLYVSLPLSLSFRASAHTGVGIRSPRPQARNSPLPPSAREVSRPLTVTQGLSHGRGIPRVLVLLRSTAQNPAPTHVYRRSFRRGRCPHRPAAPAGAETPASLSQGPMRPRPVIPSQCSHWRGNPFPAPAGAESPCLPHPAVIIPYILPNFFAKNLEIH